MQPTSAAKGQDAFFRTNNSGYGTHWQAGQTNDPMEVPQYRDLVSFVCSQQFFLFLRFMYFKMKLSLIIFSFRLFQGQRDLALKNSQRTFKHQILREMREKGELDTQIYGKIKEDMASIKKQDVVPRPFPARAEELTRPENALKIGNALYTTTAMSYGQSQPAQADMPIKYFPRPEAFTSTFLGGQYSDTGLNTVATKSRLPKNWDP